MDSPAIIVAMVILFAWVAVEMVGLFGAKFGGHHLGLLGPLFHRKKKSQPR